MTNTMIRILTFFIFYLFYLFSTLSQSIANYATVRTTGIGYSSIASPGISFSSWRNTATFTQDDNRSNFTDIGFDFWYDGVRYTQYSVSSNGYLDFSSSTANGGPTTGPYGYANSQFTASGSGTWLALAPIYDDMTAQGGVDALGNSVKNIISGTAPNRVLTIEWINMAVYQNTTPSLNFQIKLYETTGKIEFVYGTMTAGTAAYTYSCGINSNNLSAAPLASQLKMQQTANTNTFSNGIQNNLTTLPTNNSLISWTPPVPANPSGTLNFSAATSSSMTLTWPNWASSNNVGYAIYNSTDGINYDFVQQTATNVITSNITGLAPSTLYFWKVYAVTEGAVSLALSGQNSTNTGGIKTAITTGSWSNAAIWSPAGVPTSADNVNINNAINVTIDINAVCNSLNIGQGASGAIIIGNSTTARSLSINTNLTVNAGASINSSSAFVATHTLSLGGNLTNNGSLNFVPTGGSVCNVTFTKNGDATLSGSATANSFNRITLTMGNSITNTLEITSNNFGAPTNFLTLNSGTLKLSIPSTVSLTPFTGAATIPIKSGLFINNANTTVNTNGGTVTLFGKITVVNGTVNIGNAADQDLLSSGGTIDLANGNINIAGKYYATGINNLSNFTISSGNFIVNKFGSTSTIDGPFQISGAGSSFNMSGGNIVIQAEGGTGQHLGYINTGASSGAVTGGVLQIGDASTVAGQIINIKSNAPVANLNVFNANVTAGLSLPLSVINDININFGTLNTNGQGISISGNWNNTGTFIPSTSVVAFIGSGAQTITKNGTETFNNITFTNPGPKTLACPIVTNGYCSIGIGSGLDISASNHSITIKGDLVNNGLLNTRKGNIILNGTVAQTISGIAITEFNNLTLNNAVGASIAGTQNLHGTLTLTSGAFTTTGQTFTLISDANATARIGTITGGSFIGNITMQRYLPVGPTGWYFLGAPISSPITLADWNNNGFIMSGFPGSDYPNFGFTNIYTYNETALGIKDSGYIPASNISNPIVFKKGYWTYIGPNSPMTITIKGAPGTMNQSFPLTYTSSTGGALEDGWNMISNPYPSSIDWDAAAWTKTNVAGHVQIWNPNNSTYASYVAGVGINGGSNIIPSSQAFWVQTTAAAPALNITENCKSNIDQAFLRNANSNQAKLLRLHITGNGFTDETAIRFMDGASKHFDDQLDAPKFFSFNPSVPNLSSIVDGGDASINSMPALTKQQSIPLRALVGASGTYTISWENDLKLGKSACLYLEDLLTGSITDISTQTDYTFNIDDTTKTPRFLIHISPEINKQSIATTCYNSANGQAIASGIGSGAFNYIWMDSLNQTIQVHNNIVGNDTLKNMAAGTYKVLISGNNSYCANIEDTIIVNSPKAFNVLSTVSHASCKSNADGAISIDSISGGTSPYQYTWSNNTVAKNLNQLAVGIYTLNIKDANACSIQQIYTIQQNSLLIANFSTNTDTIYLNQAQTLQCFNTSSNANTHIWNFGDSSANSNLPNPSHQYTIGGNYQIQLIAYDNNCTDTITRTVYVLSSPTALNPINISSEQVFIYSENNNCNIEFKLNQEIPAIINITNAEGKHVINAIKTMAFKNKINIPLYHFSNGMYVVSIEIGSKIFMKKLIMTNLPQ
jgi:hypothetical protein